MAQMWLLWWPKNTCSTKTGGDKGANGSSSRDRATSGRSSVSKNGSTSIASCCCGCVARIVRKVKKQSKEMVRSAGTSRQSSFQCRYDPLSYSLNFDRSGCGGSVDGDDDYYHFYAFSSRFVANPRSRPACSTHVLQPTA